MVKVQKKNGLKLTNVETLLQKESVDKPAANITYEHPGQFKEAHFEKELESNMIFGMDGDLFMLLLGLNRPECYIMRRWQGISVNDFEEPEYSKIDPWNVGMVYVDIQYIREGLLYEFLRKYIDDEA